MPFDVNQPKPPHEACKWAALCHMGGVASVVLFPLLNVLIPLCVWLLRRDDHPYVDHQGREAVNFQITMAGPLLIAEAVSGFVEHFVWDIFGYMIFLPVLFAQLAGTLVGTMRAFDGEIFQYPFIFRLVRPVDDEDLMESLVADRDADSDAEQPESSVEE